MIITSKFASVCPCCSQRIVPGAKVEWSKGSPAKHTACAQGPAVTISAAPARRSYAGRRGTWTGCSCGSVTEYSKASDCWTCRHDAE
jgi:hypothetical protein